MKNMEKILITGASGFSGKHLHKILSVDSCQLFLTDRHVHGQQDSVKMCELSDFRATQKLISKIRPDEIYHLAGGFSDDFDQDFKSNVVAAKNIFDSLLVCKVKARVLLIGSAAEYGKVEKNDNPISEEHPLRPISIHGLTKTYQTILMNYYHRVHNLNIVMARTFNLWGEGMSNLLFVGTLYEQIEKYKKGKISRISLGNLGQTRDYINIADAVKNYRNIMKYGISGNVYNVGNGKPIKLSALARRILEAEGLDMGVVETDKNRKKTRVSAIYADVRKLRLLTI